MTDSVLAFLAAAAVAATAALAGAPLAGYERLDLRFDNDGLTLAADARAGFERPHALPPATPPA